MPYERIRKHLEEVISRLGMAVQPVLASETNPHFAYTVGQHSKGLPELIVFGIPPHPAASLLHQLAAHVEAEHAAGRTIGPGLVDLEGYQMATALIEVPAVAAREYATHADSRSNGQARFLQAVWPDQAGLYPWQHGFDERYRESQVVLGPPLEGAAGAGYLH